MKMIRSTILAPALVAIFPFIERANLFSEETAKEPVPVRNTASKIEPDRSVTLSGTLWAGYGIADQQSAFIKGTNGPQDQASGFRISRALFNIDAYNTAEGKKGPGVRISPIAQSTLAQAGATCRSQVNPALPQTCAGANDYYFGLYHAYGDLPLFHNEHLLLRIGQQQVPGASSPVHDLSQAMGHRFLDLIPSARTGPSSAFENLGFTSATDRGVSVLYSTDHGGIHLMLGNDGSGSMTNGQNIAVITENTTAAKLDAAARGYGGSYGTDLHGLINWRPTGRSQQFQLDFSLPFTLKNIYGVLSREYNFTAVDLTCAAGCDTNPRVNIIRGNERARKDVYAGFQTDVQWQMDDFRFQAGGGPFFFLDRRGQALMLTERELNPNDFFYIQMQNFSNPVFVQEMLGNNLRYERDSLGRALYLYASLYFRDYGFFVQLTTGSGTGIDSSTGRMTGAATAPSTIPWAVQVAQYELQYYGTTSSVPAQALFLLRNNVDTGQAHFQKIVAALVYRVSETMRIALVQSAIQATRADGTPVKTNPLNNVYGFAVNGGLEGQSLSSQMDQSWLMTRGLPAGVTVNDLIGTVRVDAQTALSMEILF